MEKISVMRKKIKLLYEFLVNMEYSKTALKHNIDNSIPDIYSKNVIELFYVWNGLKNAFPDLIIKSGYRCDELNKLVHGMPASYHTTCAAIDFASIHGKQRTKDLIFPIYEYLRNHHKTVGYIYYESEGNYIHIQIN